MLKDNQKIDAIAWETKKRTYEKIAAEGKMDCGNPRACLKIHSRHLHAPLCGIFGPNSGYIARYAPFIWPKSPTKCNAQLPESNFQTRSSEMMLNHMIQEGRFL